MNLKILAISDTHLGEETSLLSFPQGLKQLWYALRESFGSGEEKYDPDEKFNVEELVLVGDIPDSALASTSQTITYTNAFIMTLRSAANIKKMVYIPGNHDHTLWTSYRERRYGQTSHFITEPDGDLIIKQGEPLSDGLEKIDGIKKPWATELLSMFFAYSYGLDEKDFLKRDFLKRIEDLDFAIANPVHAKKIRNSEGEDRTYVFAHGTHFRWDVTSPSWVKKLCEYSYLIKKLVKIDIESGGDVTQAKNLKDLEECVTPFVDSLWVSSKNNPTTRSDQLWYLGNLLMAKSSDIPLEKQRNVGPYNDLIPFDELDEAIKRGRIWPIKTDNASIKRWNKFFLPHMREYLEENGILQDDLTFVYGDTHEGGYGEISPTKDIPEQIHMYNCGGWVMHQVKEYHPACHLFAVDEDGREYLLDVSYLLKNGEVEVDGDPLRELARIDAENRYRNSSKMLRALLTLL